VPEPSRAVLITGCSAGIGRATALRLAGRGWRVYASARSRRAIADLERAGCCTLELDVTDEHSMTAAVAAVERDEGAVGVLVNNAGYGESGALETIPLDAARRQFETNLFGPMRLIQLVVGGMREQRWGKIVNLGSMGGRLTLPGGGHYHATKYALEAISDLLRFELRGFGIDVILIEPGLITTRFAQTAVAGIARRRALTDHGAARHYERYEAAVANATVGAYDSPLRFFGGGPERVAEAIEAALRRRRARGRVPVTASARLAIATRRLVGDRGWDALLRTQVAPPS